MITRTSLKRPQDRVIVPERVSPGTEGFDLDTMIKDLLDIRAKLPRSDKPGLKGSIDTQVKSLIGRWRLRGYTRHAEAVVQHMSQVTAIIQHARSASLMRADMEKLFLEQQYAAQSARDEHEYAHRLRELDIEAKEKENQLKDIEIAEERVELLIKQEELKIRQAEAEMMQKRMREGG